MEGAKTLHRPPPPSDGSMVLLDDVVEILHTPQLAVERQDFLFNGRCKCLRVRGMLIGADGEWEASVDQLSLAS